MIKRFFNDPFSSLILAFLVLAAVVVYGLLSYAHLRPGAPLIYTYEDPYIHMSMAKNLALHGVMGLNPGEFTSSSSSILWTLTLAGFYKLFGVNSEGPLWLNLLFSCLVVWQSWRMLRRAVGDRPWLLLGGTLAVVLFTPLAPLILSGMETSLHIFLALLFLETALELLSPAGGRVGWGAAARLLVTGALFAFTRYEDLAMIGFVSVLLVLVCRQFKIAALLMAASLIPMTVFGLYALSQGWSFLPNSLLIRGVSGVFNDPFAAMPSRISQLWGQPHLFVLMMAALGGLLLDLIRPLSSTRPRWIATVFVLTLMAHILVDQFGYFYRYEAYLMATGSLAMVMLWGPRIGSSVGRISRASTESEIRALLAGLLIFLALMPLYVRGMTALRETPYAMANTYDQQYQMAHFLNRYYKGQGVALHDIGVVSFLSDVYVIDLVGLANRDTARVRLEGAPPSQVIDGELAAHQVKVAITYKGVVYLPADWIEVGEWTVDRRVTVGATTVTFYASDQAGAEVMRAHLVEFAPDLPAGVRWKVR